MRILTWAEAYAAGPPVCGGKGFNLARLARYGFRVPVGGVLPAAVYRDRQGIREAVDEFLQREGLADVAVAVRSSATAEDSARASFAGIHRSVLNVRGADAMEAAIAACYDSLSSPQARAYRQKMGFSDDEVDCAVVICRMVDAVCAGVAFTADPRTGRRDLIVIDAAAGLGENVVSGKVTPQRFVFRRFPLETVVTEAPRENPLLTERQAAELAAVSMRIHWALGDGQDPQDIEWAHDGRELWILQARPVTRLPRPGPEALRRLPRYWSTANIKDSLPGVQCELTWSGCDAVVAEVAFAALRVGSYEIPPGVELVRRFEGRSYFDMTFMQWLFYDGLGVLPAAAAASLGGNVPEISVPPGNPLQGKAGSSRRKLGLRLLRRLWGFVKRTAPYFRQHIAQHKREAELALQCTTREQLREAAKRIVDLQRPLYERVGLANAASGPWTEMLRPTLARLFGDRGPALQAALSAGSGEVVSAEHGYRVAELAEIARRDPQTWQMFERGQPLPAESPFGQAWQRFLDDFGHRASAEADLRCPRWADDPSPILDQLRQAMTDGIPRLSREAAVARRRQAEEEVRRRSRLLWPVISWMARGLCRAWSIRELAKSALVAFAFPFRRIVLQVGRILVAGGHLTSPEQVFDLANVELIEWFEGRWDGRGARELVEDRAARREAWLLHEPPDNITDEGVEIPPAKPTAPIAGGGWVGVAAAPGRAEGRARIVLRAQDGLRLLPGEILVAPSTDPGWTPLFLRAAALVTDTGGYLSHGSIVAREYGLPAVVNVSGILKNVKDGDWLIVDGDRGQVAIRAAAYNETQGGA